MFRAVGRIPSRVPEKPLKTLRRANRGTSDNPEALTQRRNKMGIWNRFSSQKSIISRGEGLAEGNSLYLLTARNLLNFSTISAFFENQFLSQCRIGGCDMKDLSLKQFHRTATVGETLSNDGPPMINECLLNGRLLYTTLFNDPIEHPI